MNISINETTRQSVNSFEDFTRILYVYGIPVICVFGIVGNIISFRVFIFRSFRSNSSTIYIAALSVSDTGFLSALLLSWLGNGRLPVGFGHSPVWCHLMIFVTYACSFLSVWYVVLIMIDRYIVVCHSLHVPEWCTKKRANITTLFVTLFACLFYSHSFFTAEVTGDNCSVQYKSISLRLLSVFIYADTALTFIVPFLIIFLLNIIVISAIRRFQSRHIKQRPVNDQTMNTLSKAQMRITQTFTLVSIVMLLTNVPSHGIRFYIVIKDVVHQPDPSLIYAQHIFQIVYYFNFAVNFLLYSVSNKKFRRYLSCKYMCHCIYRRRSYRLNDHLYT